MPELYFRGRWPDGETQRYYSPSTVVEGYSVKGGVYGVAEFVERSRQTLSVAGERVREKYGFPSTGSSRQFAETQRAATAHVSVPGATVTVEAPRTTDGSER